jgi:hypothetical protein
MMPKRFEVERLERFVLSVLALIIIAVLMLTHTIDHEDGLAMIIYLFGFTIGGQYGPKVTTTEPKPRVTKPAAPTRE